MFNSPRGQLVRYDCLSRYDDFHETVSHLSYLIMGIPVLVRLHLCAESAPWGHLLPDLCELTCWPLTLTYALVSLWGVIPRVTSVISVALNPGSPWHWEHLTKPNPSLIMHKILMSGVPTANTNKLEDKYLDTLGSLGTNQYRQPLYNLSMSESFSQQYQSSMGTGRYNYHSHQLLIFPEKSILVPSLLIMMTFTTWKCCLYYWISTSHQWIPHTKGQ